MTDTTSVTDTRDTLLAWDRIADEALPDSRQPCDCWDCDGFWCVWCFEHHGKKPCPFVEGIRRGD